MLSLNLCYWSTNPTNQSLFINRVLSEGMDARPVAPLCNGRESV
jgi:hypothetical protein